MAFIYRLSIIVFSYSYNNISFISIKEEFSIKCFYYWEVVWWATCTVADKICPAQTFEVLRITFVMVRFILSGCFKKKFTLGSFEIKNLHSDFFSKKQELIFLCKQNGIIKFLKSFFLNSHVLATSSSESWSSKQKKK